MLQAIKESLVSRAKKVSDEVNILQPSIVWHLGKIIKSYQIGSHISKILQNFLFTQVIYIVREYEITCKKDSLLLQCSWCWFWVLARSIFHIFKALKREKFHASTFIFFWFPRAMNIPYKQISWFSIKLWSRDIQLHILGCNSNISTMIQLR